MQNNLTKNLNNVSIAITGDLMIYCLWQKQLYGYTFFSDCKYTQNVRFSVKTEIEFSMGQTLYNYANNLVLLFIHNASKNIIIQCINNQ